MCTQSQYRADGYIIVVPKKKMLGILFISLLVVKPPLALWHSHDHHIASVHRK